MQTAGRPGSNRDGAQHAAVTSEHTLYSEIVLMHALVELAHCPLASHVLPMGQVPQEFPQLSTPHTRDPHEHIAPDVMHAPNEHDLPMGQVPQEFP